jgi:septation ring formation regulator EzrA
MVIHDLRNPTSQINFAIQYALQGFDKSKKQMNKNEEKFNKEFTEIKEEMNKIATELNDKLI